MPDELERSVELLERLLGDPHLRRRFRTDAATVLTEAGLPELAAGLGHGGRALMTLEMRESRSSLAGVMVAAAAEGVDLAQFAEHAAPALARDADAAVHHLMAHPHHPPPRRCPTRRRPSPPSRASRPQPRPRRWRRPNPRRRRPPPGDQRPTPDRRPRRHRQARRSTRPPRRPTPPRCRRHRRALGWSQGPRRPAATTGASHRRVGRHQDTSPPITSPPITSPRAPRPHRRRLTRPTPDRRTLAIRPPPSSSRPGWAPARRRPGCRRSCP